MMSKVPSEDTRRVSLVSFLTHLLKTFPVFFIPKSVLDREKNKDMKKSQNPTPPILNINQKQDY